MSVRVEEFLNASVCVVVVAMKGVCVLTSANMKGDVIIFV